MTEDERNIKVLRYHAGICSNATKVEIKGPALKEQARIFNGAADTIQRLRTALQKVDERLYRAVGGDADRLREIISKALSGDSDG